MWYSLYFQVIKMPKGTPIFKDERYTVVNWTKNQLVRLPSFSASLLDLRDKKNVVSRRPFLTQRVYSFPYSWVQSRLRSKCASAFVVHSAMHTLEGRSKRLKGVLLWVFKKLLGANVTFGVSRKKSNFFGQKFHTLEGRALRLWKSIIGQVWAVNRFLSRNRSVNSLHYS